MFKSGVTRKRITVFTSPFVLTCVKEYAILSGRETAFLKTHSRVLMNRHQPLSTELNLRLQQPCLFRNNIHLQKGKQKGSDYKP